MVPFDDQNPFSPLSSNPPLHGLIRLHRRALQHHRLHRLRYLPSKNCFDKDALRSCSTRRRLPRPRTVVAWCLTAVEASAGSGTTSPIIWPSCVPSCRGLFIAGETVTQDECREHRKRSYTGRNPQEHGSVCTSVQTSLAPSFWALLKVGPTMARFACV
jgi:hypothetical protein